MRDDYRREYGQSSSVALYAEDPSLADPDATELLPTIPLGAITPPHFRAVTRSAALTLTRKTIADLRFPERLVRARAEEITSMARAGGALHSLRLWRDGYEQALLTLARESCGAAQSAPCESFFWEQQGDEFAVAATFGPPAPALLH